MNSVSNNSLFKVEKRICHKDDFFEGDLGPLNLTHFINEWTIKYPLDRVWREKHDIAFNSPSHRNLYVTDLLVELVQDIIYKNIPLVKKDSNNYLPDTGNIFKRKVTLDSQLTKREIIEEFENLDLEEFEDK